MNRLWPIFCYDHPALIRVIWEKSERFRRVQEKPTPVLQPAVADARTVLDFGGTSGGQTTGASPRPRSDGPSWSNRGS